jgi:hypothetical protein
MIVWWFTQAILHYDPEFWWHPFRTFSIGTCIFQWGALIILLLALNRPIRRLLFSRGTPETVIDAGAPDGALAARDDPARDGDGRGNDS